MMTKEEMKHMALQALDNLKGDDLFRARSAFKNYSPEKMNQPYGQNNKTPAQILSEYEAFDAKVNQTIAWVKSL
jgi:hypothetical protein